MKKEWLVKTLAIGVVVLFIGVCFQSVFAVEIKTRNVTVILEGEIGGNHWFVSCVNVTFDYNPEEVYLIYYKLDSGDWSIYSEMFQVCEDGPHEIMWYCIDVNGTQSAVAVLDFKIDKTIPEICLGYEVKDWNVIFTATAMDETSGMNKVDFYKNGIFQETVNGSGPIYQWKQPYLLSVKIIGLILNPEITDEYVNFYAAIVKISGSLNYEFIYSTFKAVAYDNAGNSNFANIVSPCFRLISFPFLGIYLFQNLSFPSHYEGYIGKFFIKATFDV